MDDSQKEFMFALHYFATQASMAFPEMQALKNYFKQNLESHMEKLKVLQSQSKYIQLSIASCDNEMKNIDLFENTLKRTFDQAVRLFDDLPLSVSASFTQLDIINNVRAAPVQIRTVYGITKEVKIDKQKGEFGLILANDKYGVRIVDLISGNSIFLKTSTCRWDL